MELREAIKELRKAKHWSQQDLAVEMGLSIRAIANYESGRVPEAKILNMFVRLAQRSQLLHLEGVFYEKFADSIVDLASIWEKPPRVYFVESVEQLAARAMEDPGIFAAMAALDPVEFGRFADNLRYLASLLPARPEDKAERSDGAPKATAATARTKIRARRRS